MTYQLDFKIKFKLFEPYKLNHDVHDVNISKNDQNSDLQKIYEWAYQWKMKFNPVPSKQAQKIVFSRKVSKPFRPDVHFDNNPVNSTSVHKHVGIILDSLNKAFLKMNLKSLLAKVSNWSNSQTQALSSTKLFIKNL